MGHFHRPPDDRPGAPQARQKLREAARQRRIFVTRQLAGLADNALIHSLVRQQKEDAARTLNALHAAESELTETPTRLSFDYLHMNNNRLGVLPSEEAYLAALLLESA